MLTQFMHSVYPKDKSLISRILKAQSSLYGKLKNLEIPSLDISDYNKRYLSDKIRNGALQLYGRLLYLSANQNYKPFENTVIVDYGGGTGVLSLLAKEAGMSNVIYTDIYDVSCNDINVLSAKLGLNIDHIICGDVDELIKYLKGNSIKVDTFLSYDVIEHIYDVKDHFHKLASLQEEFRLVYASAANIENRLLVRRLRKMQYEAEYLNMEKAWGHKERDSLRAYYDTRKDIIAQYAPGLKSEEVEKLSSLTRGLMRHDIELCVDEYYRDGVVSYSNTHPSNTCDPYTGNWKEHLMNFDWLLSILECEGISAEILAGYYNISGKFAKKYLKAAANILIKLIGKKAVAIAPYYVLYADYRSGNEHN